MWERGEGAEMRVQQVQQGNTTIIQDCRSVYLIKKKYDCGGKTKKTKGSALLLGVSEGRTVDTIPAQIN